MAKQQRKQDFDFIDAPDAAVDVPAGAVAEAPGADVEPAVEREPEAPASPRYRVSLACPTPLAFPSLEVEARNEQEARALFCKANGISDSVHNWSVVRGA